jgi:hypothetical protein
MFRAAYRSSSGALNCICSLWFIYPCGDRPLSRLSGKWMSLELLMMNGVLETFSAFNKLWNNKFYYKLHLVGFSTEAYYDARIHEYQTVIYLGKSIVKT